MHVIKLVLVKSNNIIVLHNRIFWRLANQRLNFDLKNLGKFNITIYSTLITLLLFILIRSETRIIDYWCN